MNQYYQILNISEYASKNDIKAAYHRLALIYHPDVCKLEDAKERFVEITLAYQSLINKADLEEKSRFQNHVRGETAQDIINSWKAQERERIRKRAQQHAGMSYQQFRKSKLYQSSFVFPKILAIFSLVLGLGIIFGSVYGTLTQMDEDPEMITINYTASAIIVFMLGIVITSFAVSRLLPFLRKA